MRRLTNEESLTLLESCNGHLYPIVFLVLFTGRHNKGPRTTISNEFPRACKRAQLNDVMFHDLRHTFASNCAMSGATEHELMTLLGHSSTRMVRTTHLSDEHLQSRVNKKSDESAGL